MTWWLIILLTGVQGTVKLPFNSEQACRDALKRLRATGDVPERILLVCRPNVNAVKGNQ